MTRLIAYALAGAVLLPLGALVLGAALVGVMSAVLALVGAITGPLGDIGVTVVILGTMTAVFGAIAGACKAALD